MRKERIINTDIPITNRFPIDCLISDRVNLKIYSLLGMTVKAVKAIVPIFKFINSITVNI